jgi:hypothetical protein
MGPEIGQYVRACRDAGVYVSVIEHLVSKQITILTHDGPEPRAELLRAIEEHELLAMKTGGKAQ